MVDLGRYAVEVLTAYAGSIALIVAIVAASIYRARRVARDLDKVESRRNASTAR